MHLKVERKKKKTAANLQSQASTVISKCWIDKVAGFFKSKMRKVHLPFSSHWIPALNDKPYLQHFTRIILTLLPGRSSEWQVTESSIRSMVGMDLYLWKGHLEEISAVHFPFLQPSTLPALQNGPSVLSPSPPLRPATHIELLSFQEFYPLFFCVYFPATYTQCPIAPSPPWAQLGSLPHTSGCAGCPCRKRWWGEGAGSTWSLRPSPATEGGSERTHVCLKLKNAENK